MSGITDSKDFILLSKIAKEKKYAQEYLGLLARRGDLGSIRIGKRWYTTAEWFENFLSDTEKRKEEMRAQMIKQETKETEEAVSVSFEIKKEKDTKVFKNKIAEKLVEIVPAMKVEPLIIAEEKAIKLPQEVQEPVKVMQAGEIKISKIINEEPWQSQKQEKPQVNILTPKQVMKPIMAERREPVAIRRPNLKFDIRRIERRMENFGRIMPSRVSGSRQLEAPAYRAKNNEDFFTAKEISAKKLQSSKEIRFEKSGHNFSPNLTENIKNFSLFFQKLAFSSALVLLFAVLSVGVFLYRKDSANFPKFEGGQVAGAQDTRLAGVSSLQVFTSSYFEARRGQTKENVSLSRVILEAALEKNQQ